MIALIGDSPGKQQTQTPQQQAAMLQSLIGQVHDLHISMVAIEEIARRPARGAAAADVEPDRTLRALLAWRQEESETLLRLVALAAADAPGDDHRTGSRIIGHGQSVTHGSSLGADPLTAMSRGRVDALEGQLVQLADVDVEGTIGEYCAGEIAKLEAKVVDLTTKLWLRSKTN